MDSRAIKIRLVLSFAFQTSKQRLIDFWAKNQNIIWFVSVRWVQHVDLFPDPILSFTKQSHVCIKVRFRCATLQASLGWISTEGEIPVKLWQWTIVRWWLGIESCHLTFLGASCMRLAWRSDHDCGDQRSHATAHSLTWRVNRDTQQYTPWNDSQACHFPPHGAAAACPCSWLQDMLYVWQMLWRRSRFMRSMFAPWWTLGICQVLFVIDLSQAIYGATFKTQRYGLFSKGATTAELNCDILKSRHWRVVRFV